MLPAQQPQLTLTCFGQTNPTSSREKASIQVNQGNLEEILVRGQVHGTRLGCGTAPLQSPLLILPGDPCEICVSRQQTQGVSAQGAGGRSGAESWGPCTHRGAALSSRPFTMKGECVSECAEVHSDRQLSYTAHPCPPAGKPRFEAQIGCWCCFKGFWGAGAVLRVVGSEPTLPPRRKAKSFCSSSAAQL